MRFTLRRDLAVVFHSLKHDHKENRMRLYPELKYGCETLILGVFRGPENLRQPDVTLKLSLLWQRTVGWLQVSSGGSLYPTLWVDEADSVTHRLIVWHKLTQAHRTVREAWSSRTDCMNCPKPGSEPLIPSMQPGTFALNCNMPSPHFNLGFVRSFFIPAWILMKFNPKKHPI